MVISTSFAIHRQFVEPLTINVRNVFNLITVVINKNESFKIWTLIIFNHVYY